MRRGLALLPVGLLVLAVVEIAVFVTVVHAIGGFAATALLLVASIAGLALLRREGVRGWQAFRAAAAAGRPPGRQVTHSLIGLTGALLLAVPGFFTAVLGLLLIVAPGRTLMRRAVERYTERKVSSAVAGDLFGPRHVKVHQDGPVAEPAAAHTVATPAGEIVQGEVIEGDIVR
ncbi:FxsA family protein [Actinoplanes sp. N902-109]|uniref:FxsA family protein n=1 Tax=Actinoplanes sp. (strain N902-109) TaxID=649831 RepID=UPI0003295D99|nr:FxsA family protein [Actinoplanes sp. N902-109]AGL17443.1 FxsA cytoplasmic membrane protein [Actinoplanes sp. N902-109]